MKKDLKNIEPLDFEGKTLRENEISKIKDLLTDKTLKTIQRYYLKSYLSSLQKKDKREIETDY